MKTIKKKFKKIILIFSVFILLFNFMIPNYVHAGNVLDDLGGVLLKPITMFLCALGDGVMDFLQNITMTYKTRLKQHGVYIFRYSPAIIFSGRVRAFDINFIDPLPPMKEKKYRIERGSDINLKKYQKTQKDGLESAKKVLVEDLGISSKYVDSLFWWETDPGDGADYGGGREGIRLGDGWRHGGGGRDWWLMQIPANNIPRKIGR